MTPDGATRGALRPSSEWRFHRDIYTARPEVAAIVHAHAPFATTLACLGRDIPAFHYMVAVAGGKDIRCAPYATFGTQQLSDHALAALAGRKACLLANHGMIARRRIVAGRAGAGGRSGRALRAVLASAADCAAESALRCGDGGRAGEVHDLRSARRRGRALAKSAAPSLASGGASPRSSPRSLPGSAPPSASPFPPFPTTSLWRSTCRRAASVRRRGVARGSAEIADERPIGTPNNPRNKMQVIDK